MLVGCKKKKKKKKKKKIEDTRIVQKFQQYLKNDRHNLYMIKVIKTALSSNDNKKEQTLNCTKSYACRTSDKVLEKIKILA